MLQARSVPSLGGVETAGLINLFDYEAEALRRLPPMVRDYYAGGAHDELTLRASHRDFEALRLWYRCLRDVSVRDLSTSMLRNPISLPVFVSPTAFHRLADPEGGEVSVARAAGRTRTLMILSSLSNTAIEEVVGAASGPIWFQLYVYRDREVTRALVDRAETAGCRAIVVTVDAQIWGRREADVRNRFQLPPGLSVKNLTPAGKEAFPEGDADSGLAAYVKRMFDPALSWRDVEWLTSITRLPIVLKGIVHPADARLAVEHGAAAILVSNHGGRQLDTCPTSIGALPRVVEAVADRAEVYLDGGVRRGTDVVKALAHGARAVGIGRPVLWGLSVAGETGVREVLEILRAEVDLAMALCGCASVAEIPECSLLLGT